MATLVSLSLALALAAAGAAAGAASGGTAVGGVNASASVADASGAAAAGFLRGARGASGGGGGDGDGDGRGSKEVALFQVRGGVLRKYTAASPQGEEWSRKWADRAWTAPDGHGGVFVVSHGNLHHCSGKGQEELWSNHWDVHKIVPDGAGGVFIVEDWVDRNGKLYHVKADKSYVKWSEGWVAQSMAVDGAGGVFIGSFSTRKLYHVSASTKDGDVWADLLDFYPRLVADGARGAFAVREQYSDDYHLVHFTDATRSGKQLITLDGNPQHMATDGVGGVFMFFDQETLHYRKNNYTVISDAISVDASVPDGSGGLFVLTDDGHFKHVVQ